MLLKLRPPGESGGVKASGREGVASLQLSTSIRLPHSPPVSVIFILYKSRSRARSSAVAFAADAYVLDFWFVSLARLVPRRNAPPPLPPPLCQPLDAAGSSSLVARYVTNEHPSERR